MNHDADRTLERRAVRANEDDADDVVMADCTNKLRTADPDETASRPASVPPAPVVPPAPEGTQEIRAEDVLEAVELLAPRAAVRPRADATQEVRAEDVLEALDLARPAEDAGANTAATHRVDIPIEEDAPIERLPMRRSSPASLAPVALEIAPSRAPYPSRPEPEDWAPMGRLAEMTSQLRAWKPPRKFRTIVEVVMAASLLILAAAGVRAHFAAPEDDETPVAAAAPIANANANASTRTGVSANAKTQAAAPPPALDVRSVPTTSTTGTLSLAQGVRSLTVDNARLSATSAVVPCGGHMVRVGNEKARHIDVPCGGTVIVDHGGKTSVR